MFAVFTVIYAVRLIVAFVDVTKTYLIYYKLCKAMLAKRKYDTVCCSVLTYAQKLLSCR